MSDTKLLQAILDKVSKLDNKVDEGFKGVNKRMDGVEKRLTKILDNISLLLARLEDDTPIIEEFDNLEKRVGKVEKQTASV